MLTLDLNTGTQESRVSLTRCQATKPPLFFFPWFFYYYLFFYFILTLKSGTVAKSWKCKFSTSTSKAPFDLESWKFAHKLCPNSGALILQWKSSTPPINNWSVIMKPCRMVEYHCIYLWLLDCLAPSLLPTALFKFWVTSIVVACNHKLDPSWTQRHQKYHSMYLYCLYLHSKICRKTAFVLMEKTII